MAFYYPWYGGPPQWRHWASATSDPRYAHDPNRAVATGSQYPGGIRRDIAATDYPALGPYDSQAAAVIDQHLAWAHLSGIDTLIESWWGPGSYEDAGLGALLDQIEHTRSSVRAAVYLETWSLFYGGQLQPGFFADPRNFSPDGRAQIRSKAVDWIAYLLNRYGRRRGMLHVEKGGRMVPVVFVYFAGLFDPIEWQQIFAQVRARTGIDAFYDADVEGADPQLLGRAFDGLHVYTTAPYTAEGDASLAARLLDPNAAVQFPLSGVSDPATVGSDFNAIALDARALGRSWAATAIPGFDDRKIRNPSFYVSRQRGAQRTYDLMWGQALQSRPDWVLITSFNEWHEGTEIEPSVEYGDEFLRRSRAWSNQVHACRGQVPASSRSRRAPAGGIAQRPVRERFRGA
jgi:hypothetical protein